MGDRDDANLKHFKSRTANKKIVEQPGKKAASATVAPNPTQIYIVLDDFGKSCTNEVDLCGWTRVGTSPRIQPIDACRGKRRVYQYMNDM